MNATASTIADVVSAADWAGASPNGVRRVIGEVTLTRETDFTESQQYAGNWEVVRCDPQTVPLESDGCQVWARFEGTYVSGGVDFDRARIGSAGAYQWRTYTSEYFLAGCGDLFAYRVTTGWRLDASRMVATNARTGEAVRFVVERQRWVVESTGAEHWTLPGALGSVGE